MKKNSFLRGIGIVLLFGVIAGCVAHAQTNLQQAAESFQGATNIVVIPYGKYDLTTKNYGFGVAALYRVSDNFWSGIRVDRINGLQTSAGVQAQLKADMNAFGLTVHPFGETSVGIGQDSLYGSVGGGAYVTLFSHEWPRTGQPPITLTFGLIGDYEHVVQAGTANDKSNQVNAGPMLHVSF